MNRYLCLLFLLFSVWVFKRNTTQPGNLKGEEKLSPCAENTSLLCGNFPVFEDPVSKSGRKIELNIVVVPALNKNAAKEPIFWLDGGPGVAATNSAIFFGDSISPYRENYDVVLVDVRGTGKSNPLNCHQLQQKESLGEHMWEMYPVQAVQDCYDSLSQYADLRQYTTTNIALDLEEVRKWLGYEKLNLFALSYGTRLAQVYMKMFPASVKSSVLWSPVSMPLKMPLYHAPYAQQALEKLFQDCADDALCNEWYPDLRMEFSYLMEQGSQKPFEFVMTKDNGDHEKVLIPWYAFHTKIRELMYSPYGLRQIPYLLHEAFGNNFQPFLSLFPDSSHFDNTFALGQYLSITCTEDVPFIKEEEALALSEGTFMGNYRVEQQLNACKNWVAGSVPDDFSEPLVSEIPTLILSGYFDPVTPPSMAEEILNTLSNAFLVSIPSMSHTFEGVENEDCFDKMVHDFFGDPFTEPNSDCVKNMTPVPFKAKKSASLISG